MRCQLSDHKWTQKMPLRMRRSSTRECRVACSERFINKIKQCRRVATRYDKLAANYLAFVKLAFHDDPVRDASPAPANEAVVASRSGRMPPYIFFKLRQSLGQRRAVPAARGSKYLFGARGATA